MDPTALPWPLSVPVLGDGIVTLRAHTPADVDPMLEMAQDPQMQRWTAIPVPHDRTMSEEFALSVIPRGWDEGTTRCWAIEAEDESGTPRYAGNVDIRGAGPVTDIGFALHPWARGQGIMSAAVRLATDWAFAEGGVEVVHWRSQVGHEASLRVAHRCGFRLHGTTPGLLVERGRVIDAWTGSLHFGDAPLPRTRWAESAVLTSDRLRLRPLTAADVPLLLEALSDPDVRHWAPALPHLRTADDARAHVAETVWRAAVGTQATWAVADRASDRLLGSVWLMGLGGTNPTSAELAYWMHPDARGAGVMTEAVRLVADHALGPAGPGLARLSLLAAAGNAASNAVARAAGFTRCGTEHRAEMLGDGTLDDLHVHELLRR